MKAPKKWFEISNASEQSADVYIYDSIGAYGVSAAGFIAEINAIKAPVINLHLNSGGGSVFDGLAIYTGIQSHPARVRVLIDGIAASMAGVIAMAGDEIVMAENAFLMIHRVSSGVEGTAETMRAEAALLEKLEEQIIAIYAARTGKSAGALFKAMQAETWYSANESLAEGFCTSVAPLKSPSNCVDLSKFAKAPAVLVDAADTGKPMPTAEIVSEPVAAVVEPVAAVVSAPAAVVTAEPVALITAESVRLAVKDAVEAAHAAAEVALNAVRADYNAKLTSKDNELAALSVKLASAENLSAAKLGVLPVVFTPAASTAPGDVLAKYRALEGAARAEFFQKNKDAIWKAYDAENAKPA